MRKEFAPSGSKFFPFREDPILEGRQTESDRELPPLKMYPFPLTIIGKIKKA